MASRNNRSPVSSRSPSPDAYSAQYDPFVSPEDPVEMSQISSRPSMNTQSNRNRGSHSPDSTIRISTNRGGFRPASYLTSHTSSQYTPLTATRHEPSGLRSASASIYSVGSVNPYSTKDADAQALADRRAGEIAEWHIHWTTPAMIIALFVSGVMAAVGHHLFYVNLDGKESTNQVLMVRYGTALAFFVKSTLVGTVIMCYRQRIWHTLRKKAMTINGIDGLFSATEDPTQFANWEMIRNGKLATLMAFCAWIIPIASVLSPASLTSEMRTTHNDTACPHVASLNFSRESFYDFRTGGLFKGVSLSYYNTTDIKGEEEGFFDYYDQPSKNLRRLAISSAYSRKTPQAINASIDNCGNGWNCTYTINFMGPGYKCDEIADDNKARLENAPFNYSTLAPIGSSMYHSNVDVGDYKSPQVESNDNGTPKNDPPYPESLGVFDSEPVLWIGYAVNKTDEPYPDDSPFKEKWKTVHEPHIFKCVMHHTNYTFNMTFQDSNQIAVRQQRDFEKPVVDTTLSMKSARSNETVASPKENFISPAKDAELYKLTASYHSMGLLLRSFLRGEISKASADAFVVTRSDVSETRLVDSATAYPVTNLMDALQDLFEDMLLTLLSEPYLVIATREKVKCQKTRTRNTYVYHRDSLWIGYALAVAITLGAIVIGAWSIHQNGVASDTLFSRILVTTRNPTLDRLSVGACLGGDPFPKELRETKLRFGVLLEDMPREGPLGKVEHCTFGTAGETKDIVKFGTYAGLKKYRKDIQQEQEEGEAWEKEALLEEYGLEMEPVD